MSRDPIGDHLKLVMKEIKERWGVAPEQWPGLVDIAWNIKNSEFGYVTEVLRREFGPLLDAAENYLSFHSPDNQRVLGNELAKFKAR